MTEEQFFMVGIPETMFEKNLSPFAFRLYFHIKVLAMRHGGTCRENARTMARHCGMSVGAVSNTKRELSDAGLIRIQKGKKNEVDTITILDVD